MREREREKPWDPPSRVRLARASRFFFFFLWGMMNRLEFFGCLRAEDERNVERRGHAVFLVYTRVGIHHNRSLHLSPAALPSSSIFQGPSLSLSLSQSLSPSSFTALSSVPSLMVRSLFHSQPIPPPPLGDSRELYLRELGTCYHHHHHLHIQRSMREREFSRALPSRADVCVCARVCTICWIPGPTSFDSCPSGLINLEGWRQHVWREP